MTKNKFLIILLFLLLLVFASCTANEERGSANALPNANANFRKYSKDYDSPAIIAELLEKANKIDSYAHTLVVDGKKQKQMFFRFSKDSKPYYSFRSEYEMNGKPYVYLYNIDGFDYECFLGQQMAYRSPTNGNWNQSNYDKAKAWHFDYKDGKIIGEDKIEGQDCYIITLSQSETCVSKENGRKLYSRHGNTIYYEDFMTDLSGDLFTVPPFLRIEDRPAEKSAEKTGNANKSSGN